MVTYKGFFIKIRFIFCIAMASGLCLTAAADKSSHLKSLTGDSRVKVVFARCPSGGAVDWPEQSAFQNEVLVGFDTYLGREDTLQTTPANYQNPLITHDGSKIIFTRITTTSQPGVSYIVDWAKNAAPKKIANGMTGCLWYDAVKKKDYAIYSYNQSVDASVFHKIAVDDSTDDVLLYDFNSSNVVITQWLRVSSDLSVMGGCLGLYHTPGSPIGMIDLTTGEKLIDWKGDCWPSMPYDTTRRLVKIDHSTWTTINPDGDIVTTNGYTLAFSQMRMPSYKTDIFLIVSNPADNSGENGTGDIIAVKTDPSFANMTDSVWISSFGKQNDHHADLWSGSDATASRPSARGVTAPAFADPGSTARILTLGGRCVATVRAGAIEQTVRRLPQSTYLVEYHLSGRTVVKALAGINRCYTTAGLIHP